MRRVSLPILALAVAGLLLGACDPRPEEEADVRKAESAEECLAPTAEITPSQTPEPEPASTPPIGSRSETPEQEPTETPAESPTSSLSETPWQSVTSTPTTSAAASPSWDEVGLTPSATSTPVTDEQTPVCPGDDFAQGTQPTLEPTTDLPTAGDPAHGVIIFTRPIPDKDPYYGMESLWRAHADGSNQTEIPLPDGCVGVGTFDLSPDGDRLALNCKTQERLTGVLPLFTLELSDHTFRRLPVETSHSGAFWSPDGARLAFSGYGGPPNVHTINADGSGVQDWGPVSGYVYRWTPDGRIAVTSGYGLCVPGPPQSICGLGIVLDPMTGEQVSIKDVQTIGDWSPDGRYVIGQIDPRSSGGHCSPAVCTADGVHAGVEVVDVIAGERRRLSDVGANIGRSALWLPDGQSFLVSIEAPAAVYTPIDCSIWKIELADLNQRTEVLPDDCRLVSVSRDGRHVYTWRMPVFGVPEGLPALYRIDLSSGEATMLIQDMALEGVRNIQVHEAVR